MEITNYMRIRPALSKLTWPIALAMAWLLISCGRNETQNKGMTSSDTLPVRPQDSEKIIFSCLHHDYGFKVFVNGEPVQCGTSPGQYITGSFPLRNGSNHVSITLSFLPKDKVPQKSLPYGRRIYDFDWSIRTQEKNNIPLVHQDVSEFAPYDTNLVWELDVPLTKVASSPSLNFEPLVTNRKELIDECCSISRKLARLFQGRDTKKLAEVFSLSKADVEKQFSKMPGITELKVTGIEDNGPLTAVNGNYFIDVFCGRDEQVNIGESLVTFSHKEGNGDYTVRIDNFLFARQNGKWMIWGADDKWLSLNASSL